MHIQPPKKKSKHKHKHHRLQDPLPQGKIMSALHPQGMTHSKGFLFDVIETPSDSDPKKKKKKRDDDPDRKKKKKDKKKKKVCCFFRPILKKFDCFSISPSTK